MLLTRNGNYDHTHASDEIGIECISEERFRQFTEVEFE